MDPRASSSDSLRGQFRRCAFLALVLSIGFVSAAQARQAGGNAAAAPVNAKSQKPAKFTVRDRLRFYQQTTFSPFALVGPLTGAAATQWVTGKPPQWGQGFPGYGRRVLSGYGRQVIANTVALGVAFALREDPRHYPTGRHGVWIRALYAARQVVVSHNTSGRLTPAYFRIVGAYTAGFVSNAWYPAPASNVDSALYRGSTALFSDVVWQEFKEFWPDIRRRLHRRQRAAQRRDSCTLKGEETLRTQGESTASEPRAALRSSDGRFHHPARPAPEI